MYFLSYIKKKRSKGGDINFICKNHNSNILYIAFNSYSYKYVFVQIYIHKYLSNTTATSFLSSKFENGYYHHFTNHEQIFFWNNRNNN